MYFNQKLDDKSHSFLMRIREDFIKTIRTIEFSYKDSIIHTPMTLKEYREFYLNPQPKYYDPFDGVREGDSDDEIKDKICNHYSVKMVNEVKWLGEYETDSMYIEYILNVYPNIKGSIPNEETTFEIVYLDEIEVNIGCTLFYNKRGEYSKEVGGDRKPSFSYRLIENDLNPPPNWKPPYESDKWEKYNGLEHMRNMILSFEDFLNENGFKINPTDEVFMGNYFNEDYTQYYKCEMEDYNRLIHPYEDRNEDDYNKRVNPFYLELKGQLPLEEYGEMKRKEIN